MAESLPIAVIVHAGKGMADGMLVSFIADLAARGWRVRGLVTGPANRPDDCATRTVRDVHTGDIYRISQDLGAGSMSCCLDPGALIEAAVVLRRVLDAQPDLAVVNRFGILEADGKGFAQEMLDIVTQGIPMLTVVSPAYLEAWRTFSGGLAQELPPQREALQAWANSLPAGQRLPLSRQAA